MDPDHVRVRLVSIDQDGVQGQAGVSLTYNSWSLVANSLLGKQVVSLTGKQDRHASILFADYIFNFNTGNPETDAKVRGIYNGILSPNLLQVAITTLNPVSKDKEIKKVFISNLVAADDFIQQEAMTNPAPARPGILRVFKGLQVGRPTSGGFKIGLGPLQYSNVGNADYNKIIEKNDQNNNEKYYKFATTSQRRNFEAVWDLYKNEFDRTSAVILSVDDKGRPYPTGPDGSLPLLGDYLSVFQTVNNGGLGDAKQTSVSNFVKRQIAPSILETMQFDQFMPYSNDNNVRILGQVLMKDEAFKIIGQMDLPSMTGALQKYLQLHANELPAVKAQENTDWATFHKSDLFSMVKAIYHATHPTSSLEFVSLDDRKTHFLKLQFEQSWLGAFGVGEGAARVYREVGLGYLMSMLPQDQLSNLVSVDLEIDSNQLKTVRLEPFGTNDKRDLIVEAQKIDSIFQRGGYDVRFDTYDLSALKGKVISVKDAANLR